MESKAKNYLCCSDGVEILLIKAVFDFSMFFLGAKTAFKYQSAVTDDFLPELTSFAWLFCPLHTKHIGLKNSELLYVEK